MNTMSADGTIRAAAAAVIGARHLRDARNGQDAAALWAGDSAAAIAVCDGCSAGTGSELGARLGAHLVVRALADRLAAGARPSDGELWSAMRADVVRELARIADRIDLYEHLLFTIVAAAATRDDAAVWLLGDGVYAFDDHRHVAGPFADNQPPYLAYDLVGDPRAAQLVAAPRECAAIAVATDGALELGDLARFAGPRYLAHPDALRRELAVRARADERIDWGARRITRVPALLQDDCAVAVLRRELA